MEGGTTQNPEAQGDIIFGPNGLRQYSRAEIEASEGKYDKDGFYILPDGSFYDYQGYYFNKEGFDENGGFYD